MTPNWHLLEVVGAVLLAFIITAGAMIAAVAYLLRARARGKRGDR